MLKYLFALWAGILVYVVLTLSFGARGFSSYRQLVQEQARVSANIENLRRTNRELANKESALSRDEPTVKVFARELGYARPQERFIRVVGLGVTPQTQLSPGELVFAAPPQHIPNRTLIIVSFFSGITVIVCMAVFDFMRVLREA